MWWRRRGTPPAPPAPVTIEHNEPSHRFECNVEGGVAFTAYYRSGNEIVFTHTEVPGEAEGQGIAGKIVAFALAYARERQLVVVPQCPYVKSYLKRHREFRDIVHPEYR